MTTAATDTTRRGGPAMSHLLDRVLLPLAVRAGIAGLAIAALVFTPRYAPADVLIAAIAAAGLFAALLPLPARKRCGR